MPNISKKRLWIKNEYDVYYFDKKQRGQFLNVWFPKEKTYISRFIDNGSKKGKDKIKETILTGDQLWTLKRVDKKSAGHLYNEIYNPVFINIYYSYNHNTKETKAKDVLYDMKACIKSIDDSSYGIWWLGFSYEKLLNIRLDLMRWVDSCKELNGDKFHEKCIELGADVELIDYN